MYFQQGRTHFRWVVKSFLGEYAGVFPGQKAKDRFLSAKEAILVCLSIS
jgi:hypothetical protein